MALAVVQTGGTTLLAQTQRSEVRKVGGCLDEGQSRDMVSPPQNGKHKTKR